MELSAEKFFGRVNGRNPTCGGAANSEGVKFKGRGAWGEGRGAWVRANAGDRERLGIGQHFSIIPGFGAGGLFGRDNRERRESAKTRKARRSDDWNAFSPLDASHAVNLMISVSVGRR
jgi:hypothetical protein